MPLTIRTYDPADRAAATALFAETVGDDFTDLDNIDQACSFVALDGAELAGALTAKVRPASETLTASEASPAADPGVLTLHLHSLAVAPAYRRAGVASGLLRRAEEAGRARGASLAVVYAWLPFGQEEPAAVPLYESAGYETFAELPGFYAEMSVATGAICPYCGEPPCRCSARVLTKSLETGGAPAGA